MDLDLLDPDQMRAFAASLFDAAERLDQARQSDLRGPADYQNPQCNPARLKPSRQPSELTLAEENKVRLQRHARELYGLRGLRARFFDQNIFGEACWDILLDLFIHYCDGRLVGVQSACIASRVPSTTALRYITLLEKCGYVRREDAKHDKRLTYLSLTDSAFLQMARFLDAWRPAPQLQAPPVGEYLVTGHSIPNAANT